MYAIQASRDLVPVRLAMRGAEHWMEHETESVVDRRIEHMIEHGIGPCANQVPLDLVLSPSLWHQLLMTMYAIHAYSDLMAVDLAEHKIESVVEHALEDATVPYVIQASLHVVMVDLAEARVSLQTIEHTIDHGIGPFANQVSLDLVSAPNL